MRSVYYNSLGAEKKTYDAALDCFLKRGRSFPVSMSEESVEIACAVLNDYPELFYVSQQFRTLTSLLRREFLPNYVYSAGETDQIRARLDAEAGRIIRAHINEHQSEFDKVRALHDYLKRNLEYDNNAGGNFRYDTMEAVQAHNIVGALLKRKCVCEGFAKAFKFLCGKVGLECWVVSGTANTPAGTEPHAWNIVRINGYYHHVDVTWDIQLAESAAIPNYGYLNLSDEEIYRDHNWNRKRYPACPSSPYNYFRVNNAMVDSKAQLETMLYNSMQMEEESTMFRVVRGSRLEREINGSLEDIIRRASGRCKHVSVSRFRFTRIPEQLTFYLQFEYVYK